MLFGNQKFTAGKNHLGQFSMSSYQLCTSCVMDTSDESIYFDADGVCSHCLPVGPSVSQASRPDHDAWVVEKIKFHGRNMDYDCILGLGG